MTDPTQEQIDALKAKHGDLKFQKIAGQKFLVRGPTGAEYQRFTDRATDEKKRIAALDELARTCCVFPDASAAGAFFERKPAATTSLAGLVLELAGISEEDSGNV